MITDEQVRWIALFFLFTLMDEKMAMQAAQRTVAQLKSLIGSDEKDNRIELIRLLRKNFTLHRGLLPRNRQLSSDIPPSSLKLPDGIDFKIWNRFQRDASEPEIVALVLGKILLFNENEIAEGLNISLGTAHYRIGKGVRQLGAYFESMTLAKA